MDYRMHSSPSETETDKASLSDGLMFLSLNNSQFVFDILRNLALQYPTHKPKNIK